MSVYHKSNGNESGQGIKLNRLSSDKKSINAMIAYFPLHNFPVKPKLILMTLHMVEYVEDAYLPLSSVTFFGQSS